MSGACSRTWEAEAALDGRLGRGSAAAFQRHAATCKDCRAEIAALERLAELGRRTLADEESAPLDRRRRRAALLRRANDALLSRPHARRRRWPVLLAAAVVLVVAFAAFARPGERAGHDGVVAGSLATNAELFHPWTAARSTAGDAPAPIVEAPAIEAPASVASAAIAPPKSVTSSPPKTTTTATSAGLATRASTTAGVDAGATFVAAMDAFHDGQYAKADALFVLFVEEAPLDGRCEDVAFLRAVAHARNGDAAGARRLVASYLAAYPDGLRRAEAERLATSLAK